MPLSLRNGPRTYSAKCLPSINTLNLENTLRGGKVLKLWLLYSSGN